MTLHTRPKLPLPVSGRLLAALAALCLWPSGMAWADDPVPVPWNGMDVGGLSPAGAAKVEGGTWTLTGGSGGLAGPSDRFHFIYQSLTGDCALSARLSGGSDPGGLTDAGLMARDALATNSNYVAVVLAPGHAVISKSRPSAPAPATVSVIGNAPLWVRLVKRGTNVQTYVAADRGGAAGTWKPVGGSRPIASGMIYVGLCLAGGMATFDHVSLAAGDQPLFDDGTYTLTPASAPGMVLAVSGGGVALAAPSGAPGQKWRLVSKGGSFYSLRPDSDVSLALTVPDAKSGNGTRVAVAKDQGQDAQVWSIVANGGDTVGLLPRFSMGIGLDDFGGASTPAAVLDVWNYSPSDPHLQWKLTPAE